MQFLETRKDLRVSHLQSPLSEADKIVALRSFTLESGQEELERLARRRKERPHDLGTDLMSESRRGSADSIRSPTSSHQRAPQLSDVPEEEGTFAIGDDEDEETDDEQPTPAASTPTEQPSRASSVSSSIDDAVPTQLRGMSEKARGKMPGKQPSTPNPASLTDEKQLACQPSPGKTAPQVLAATQHPTRQQAPSSPHPPGSSPGSPSFLSTQSSL
jgi:hypothetical protein